MFFNFGLQQIDGFGGFDVAEFEKELAALASVATAAAVNSPAVVDSPKNTTPATTAVQAVVNQVVAAVAPVVAPTVPATVISKLEPIVTDAVVTNPKVVSSGAGVAISATATNQIATTISKTFKTDAQKDAELASAIKTAVPQPGTTSTTTAKPDAVNLPFDTTKPATSATMPFDTTKPVTTVNLTTTTATATSAANVQTPQNFTGEGYQNKYKQDPLLLDGKAFTGVRNGIEYKDGYPVSATRADVLEANRNAAEAAETANRAATNPLFDPTNRPQGAIDKGYIVYWSWIGGRTNGEWRQYRVPVTPENMAKYGSRVFSGSTQATFENVAGTGALDVQPMPTYDKDGNITGYTLGGTTLTTSGLTKATTSGATTGTTTTGTTTTGTTTTGTTTGGATTGVTTGGTTTGATTGGFTGGTTGGFTGGTTGGFTGGFGSSTTTAVTTTPITSVTSPTTDMGRESIIKTLQDRFAKYGLSSLANKIRDLAIEGATEATITLQLQETPEYIQRFGANQTRIKAGLTVLTPAEYLNLEDGYRQVLRAYGLRQFDNDAYVQQFIANDMSPAELSNRVVTAVQRVQNADPAITRQLRDFYGIGTNDLVAYVLDPQQQFQKIERQVAAAEIGAAARLQGFDTGVTVAEQLAAQGITQAEARRGYSTIADILPTAEKLSQIYSGQEQAYGLAEAEQEVFNSLAEAQRRRTRLTQRELAQFSGTSGVSRVGLTESRAGQFQNPQRVDQHRQAYKTGSKSQPISPSGNCGLRLTTNRRVERCYEQQLLG